MASQKAVQAFIADVASRLVNRIQPTSDAHQPYLEVLEQCFGAKPYYAMVTKHCSEQSGGQGKFRSGKCVAPSCSASKAAPMRFTAPRLAPNGLISRMG